MQKSLGLRLGMIPASARPTATTAPENVEAPSITGIQTQGQTVMADPGEWLGLPSALYDYQWQRNGVGIVGATAASYVLAGADVGADITVEVTGTNDIGSTTAESAAIVPAATLTLTGTPGDGAVGAAYSFTPVAAGGHAPRTFALTGTLQTGLSFNTSTGAITGTPSSSGTASGLNITVTDANGLTAALGVFDIAVSAANLNGDLIEAEVMGVGPITNAGTIDSNGRIIRMRFKGMAVNQAVDISKCTITVTLPGWNTSKVYSATNITETMGVRGKVRRPYNGQALNLDAAAGSDVDVYLFLDRPIPKAPSAVTSIALTAGFYGASNAKTLTTITNSSTRAFRQPQFGWHQQRYWSRMTSSGMAVECTVDHDGARDFQTVAVVEPYVHIGATEYGSIAINAMTQSTKLSGRPFALSVFAGTIPQASAPNGQAFLDARVYPFVGDTIWDTAISGAVIPTNSNCPAGLPINVDTDNSYTLVGAYVSHTGVQIGTPSIKALGSLGSYASEGAYATAAALATAGRTYNNNGANRTRAHDDIAAVCALAPNGVKIAGLGASLSSLTTYPVGLGHMWLMREAGSTKATTGWTYAASGTNKTVSRRTWIYDCNITPGAVSTADHTVFQQNSSTSNVTSQPTLANAVDWGVEACVGTGANESTNAVFLNKGFIDYWNNDFNDFAGSPYQQSTSFYAGVRSVAGCDLNNSSAASASAIECGYVVATRIRQLRIELNYVAGVVKPFPAGAMFWNTDLRQEGQVNTTFVINQLSTGNAIDARGVSILGLSVSRTRVGFTGVGDGAPTIQIASDYNSGAGTDMPGIENLNMAHVSTAGPRINWLYNEAAGTPVFKERDACVLGVACSQKNNKADVAVAGGGANGARMGPLPFRYGQNVNGVVSGDLSANGTVIGIGQDCWLSEVLPPNSQDNVGYANLYTTDTSMLGTNVFANAMDWSPKAALKNRLAAGRAKVPYDRLGTAMRNDGTGAVGCLSY